jgi:hypothetical protein
MCSTSQQLLAKFLQKGSNPLIYRWCNRSQGCQGRPYRSQINVDGFYRSNFFSGVLLMLRNCTGYDRGRILGRNPNKEILLVIVVGQLTVVLIGA